MNIFINHVLGGVKIALDPACMTLPTYSLFYYSIGLCYSRLHTWR